MHAEPFDYCRAETIDHAIETLAASDDARVLAGGHGLIPLLKKRKVAPGTLVDIGDLDALEGIERTAAGIRIGALTTHTTVRESELLQEAVPVYPRTVSNITGGRQVHNFATIGGNIARAHPGYDYEGTVLATNSDVVVEGPDGEQTMPAADFFCGALSTSLDDAQLVKSVLVPAGEEHRRGGYAKRKEPGSGNAIVGVATDLVFESEQADHIESARVGVNGLQGSAVRLTAVEETLADAPATEDTIRAAAAAAGDSVTPSAVLDNKKASSEYRLAILGPQVRKSLEQATATPGEVSG